MTCYRVDFIGVETSCYGTLEETSNFAIVCENAGEDTIWCDGNPSNKSGVFSTWEDVVTTLQPYFKSNIIEISAV